jgi:ABC-type dipeptide/oligopeptide/nickel transport system ATPase component
MSQRVLIAMALVNRPALLIADEPGTALDVTVQAQTLRLMDEMIRRIGTAVLFISHNLGVVREFADRVYVIYRGHIVEHATADQLFADPRHPYTQALLQAVPKIVAGGLPELPEQSPRFLEPLIVHAGCGEPAELTA